MLSSAGATMLTSPRPACGERSDRSYNPGEGDSPRVRVCGESPSPQPSPRKRGEGEVVPLSSSREPISTPDQVRGRLSLENALIVLRSMMLNAVLDEAHDQHQASARRYSSKALQH